MAIIIEADVEGGGPETYDAIFANVGDALRGQPGFLAHWAGWKDGVWTVGELWDSNEAAAKYFAEFVKPNLPPGVTPKRHIRELHKLVRA